MFYGSRHKVLYIVRWFDNKPTTLVSTYVAIEPKSIATQWDKASKQYISIPRPNIVDIYNKHMGGVDLLDMLIALYRTPIK